MPADRPGMQRELCHEAWYEVTEEDQKAMLEATTWSEADFGYFRGGGYSSRFVTEAQMPRIFESSECVGTVKKNIADELGIGCEVIVAAGAGDNAAAAVGTGTVGDGHCNISLGTSGTIFISSKEFGVDSNNALHSFAHADGKYHLMGCILSAASANGWWMDKIIGTNDYAGEQSQITDDDLGNNNVYFLPYLMGERSPHNDEFARGTFTGMTMDTERKDMTQAVLEGVALQ